MVECTIQMPEFIFHGYSDDSTEIKESGYVISRRVYDGMVVVKYIPLLSSPIVDWKYVIKARKPKPAYHVFKTEEDAVQRMFCWFDKKEIDVFYRQRDLISNVRS